MSDTVTRGIRVQVRASYVSERSAPGEGEYFFAYRIRISNVGSETARLVSRRWIIAGPTGEEVDCVEGPGVVGQQPILPPGEFFEYTSFCPLSTPLGSMRGWYTMVTAGGETFEAEIAPFSLSTPSAVN
jgi:ApaG protein